MCESENRKACWKCGGDFSKKYLRRGMCRPCHKQWIANGGDMSVLPIGLREQGKLNCAVCGRERKRRRGDGNLCHRCYMYRHKHGKDWTPEVSIRGKYDPRPLCVDCKTRKAYYRKPMWLCERCFDYRKRNGKRRPKYKDADHCLNCGRLRDFSNKRSFTRGRCHACYRYWLDRDRKVERPPKFWASALGMCDCGKPAKHNVKIAVHNHLEDMPLCDECNAEYMQQVKLYGVDRQTKNHATNG